MKQVANPFITFAHRLVLTCILLIGLDGSRAIPPADAQETHQIGSTLQASIRPSAPLSSSANPVPAASPAPVPNQSISPSQLTPMAEIPVVPDRIVRIDVQSGANGIPTFDPPRVEVTAGQQVEIILKNKEAPNSGISHNWVLIKPGSESAVAALGKEAGVDPDAVTYSPSILAATRTTRPGSQGIVDFLAPEAPGAYPFISLVGDQRRVLRGVLVVKPVDKVPS